MPLRRRRRTAFASEIRPVSRLAVGPMIPAMIRQAATALTVLVVGSGCVTVAEFRKLEKQVVDLQRERTTIDDPRVELADQGAEIEALRGEVRRLEGRVDLAEKTATDALAQARKARQELASRSLGTPGEPPELGADDGGEEPGDADPPPGMASAEVAAYREALTAARSEDLGGCVDRFREFLQTYPASDYADDAAFWIGDCHFKQGDYKNAVLRFDDVVRNYPTGNKAPDALYRQGESLLRLGPRFHEAAKRAFERVLKEYPDSPRAAEAKRQLEVIAAS